MPGCEMSENSEKYLKSKPKMAEQGKISKSQIQKTNG